ncbi:hypothetical protein PVIIG_05674 [Plasmodium vivax India VII]|uniref:Variable surface protein n=1 Tax=Plasmodium vivax India VII TaxID=1077284 RepID=A0A0J9UTX0_PLAVI|nr:hypothetical protein PVIIG_05674 [Plasmodium vivax India VII]
MIYGEFYSTDFRNTCNPLYKDIDKDTFNTYKMLHDYSNDYGNIKIDTSYGYTTCNEDYKEFIEKYINTYNVVYSNCKIEKTNKYDCKYFNELFKKYNHSDLSSFHCMQHNVQTHPTHEQEELELSTSSLSVHRTSRENSVSIVYPKPQGKDGQILSHYPHETHDLAVRQGLGSDVSTPIDETAKSGSTKTIMGSVVPVLGVSSISLLLYKVIRKIIENTELYFTCSSIDYDDTKVKKELHYIPYTYVYYSLGYTSWRIYKQITRKEQKYV